MFIVVIIIDQHCAAPQPEQVAQSALPNDNKGITVRESLVNSNMLWYKTHSATESQVLKIKIRH